jgi:hypothetical protein
MKLICYTLSKTLPMSSQAFQSGSERVNSLPKYVY